MQGSLFHLLQFENLRKKTLKIRITTLKVQGKVFFKVKIIWRFFEGKGYLEWKVIWK